MDNSLGFLGNVLTPSLLDIFKCAKFIFEIAGLKGNQLAFALDNVFKFYTGKSALEAGEVDLIAPTQCQLLTPKQLAVHFGFSNTKRGVKIINYLLEEAGYQYKTTHNSWEPSELGKPFAVLLDTNKKHSDGSPVRLLKWNSNIIHVLDGLLVIRKGRFNLAKT